MLKIPFIRRRGNGKKSPRTLPAGEQCVNQNGESISTSQWFCKAGVQVDETSVKLCGEIQRNSMDVSKPISVDVVGRVSNASAAVRIGNHRPAKTLSYRQVERTFNDIQVCVADVDIREIMHHQVKREKTRFGDFSLLSVHCLFGTLLCLDDADLIGTMDAFRIVPHQQSSSSMPSPMLTWQFTNQIVKVFRASMEKVSASERAQPGSHISSTKAVTIPLLASWNSVRAQQNPRPSPLVSVFFRNYGELSDDHRVVAASMESIDVALTTSSLHCVASMLDACSGSALLSAVPLGDYASEDLSGRSRTPGGENVHRAVAVEDIQMSVLLGQIRLILPSESLSEAIASKQEVCSDNVLLVIESSSASTSVWNEISLDGLGYPPFNATKLPRRQKPQSQRLGESKLRLGCKIGNVYGAVAAFVRSDGKTVVESGSTAGPCEAILSQTEGVPIQMRASDTFLFPFNAALDVEEDRRAGDAVETKTRRATLSITRIRLEVQKNEYDAIVGRSLESFRAISSLLHSPLWRAIRKRRYSKSRSCEPESEAPKHTSKSQDAVYEVACDGVEVALSSMESSIHVRIGSMNFAHNRLDGSGGFSVQNVVAGFRFVGHPNNVGNLASREELVFGTNSDPALWQLGADNYPEKLLSGRWSSLDHNESTLFLDMQAYQLHLSGHLMEQISQFLRFTPTSLYSSRGRTNIPLPLDNGSERDIYSPKRKTSVKILVAPSVISVWERLPHSQSRDVSTSVWVSCGQTFVSVGIGTEESSRHKLLKANGDDAIHELNRFFSVHEMDFMLNLEKIAVKTSSETPVLGIDFRYGTVGSLPSHVASNWGSFSKHLNSGSARLRLLGDSSIRVTGDRSTMVERQHADQGIPVLVTTALSRMNLQGELSAVELKVSSSSVGSLVALLSAIQPSARTDSDQKSVSPSVASSVDDTRDILEKATSSTDDFNYLRRMAGARHPTPGELVLTESLFIETGISSGGAMSSLRTKTAMQVDEIDFNNYDQIEEADLLSFIDEVNTPWEYDDSEPQSEAAALPVFENKTRSWMGMRWCYHIPRVVDEIVANPVPIPPTGIPNGWPTWHGNSDTESGSARLCDFFCQLRCWDYQQNRFVVVSEFFVPWEQSSSSKYRMDAADLYESGSFGDFVTQWFEEDMAEYEYHAKLLELASAARRIHIQDASPSDKWELRWRSPIFIDKEAEVRASSFSATSLFRQGVLT